uniref:PDZ domain-containing protein n=1 Tax=Guillardia theta TaxID=55529 RepID=A0A7S4UMU1_GUITH|mmetsp:Transcript_48215/g.151251  ORF Transcript_48215/g.151251 Transcript_48215/m.151251 type:complete len:1014 (+) Transcript_48215:175-3216(+)
MSSDRREWAASNRSLFSSPEADRRASLRSVSPIPSAVQNSPATVYWGSTDLSIRSRVADRSPLMSESPWISDPPKRSSLNRSGDDPSPKYGIGLKVENRYPHIIQHVTNLQDPYGHDISDRVQVGDILELVDGQAVTKSKDRIDYSVLGDYGSVVKITLRSKSSGELYDLQVRRHLLFQGMAPDTSRVESDLLYFVFRALNEIRNILVNDTGSHLKDAVQMIHSCEGVLGLECGEVLGRNSLHVFHATLGSPAHIYGGLMRGDEVVKFEETSVQRVHLQNDINVGAIGSECRIRVKRGQKEHEIKLFRTSANAVHRVEDLFKAIQLLREKMFRTLSNPEEMDPSIKLVWDNALLLEKDRQQIEASIVGVLETVQTNLLHRVSIAEKFLNRIKQEGVGSLAVDTSRRSNESGAQDLEERNRYVARFSECMNTLASTILNIEDQIAAIGNKFGDKQALNTWTISYKNNEIANFEDQLRKKEEIIRKLEDEQEKQSRSLEAIRIEEQRQQSESKSEAAYLKQKLERVQRELDRAESSNLDLRREVETLQADLKEKVSPIPSRSSHVSSGVMTDPVDEGPGKESLQAEIDELKKKVLELEKSNSEYRVLLEKEKLEAQRTHERMMEMEKFKEELITQMHSAHQELNQNKQALQEKEIVAKEVLKEFASLQRSQEASITSMKDQIAEFCRKYSTDFSTLDDSNSFESLNVVFNSAVELVTEVIQNAEERREEAEASRRECERLVSEKEELIRQLEQKPDNKESGDKNLSLIMQQISDLKEQLADLQREKTRPALASQESLRTDPLLLKKIDISSKVGLPLSPSQEQRKLSRPTSSSVSVADFQDYTFTSSDVRVDAVAGGQQERGQERGIIGFTIEREFPFRVLEIHDLVDEYGNTINDAIEIGDMLTHVDGEDITDETIHFVLQKLSGPPGGSINLIFRTERASSYEVVVQRHRPRTTSKKFGNLETFHMNDHGQISPSDVSDVRINRLPVPQAAEEEGQHRLLQSPPRGRAGANRF